MNINIKTLFLEDEDYGEIIQEVWIDGKRVGAFDGATSLLNVVLEHLNIKARVNYED